jgi:signal transduction histidine kinase
MSKEEKEGIRTQLDELGNDVQEIDQLIGTMLSYARLDHPDLKMNWQKVPLDAWLAQAIDKCRQPDIEISIVNSEAIDVAWMDSRLMSLAISNLLVNACRYANRRVQCTIRRANSRYQIEIEDDGHGIPDSERETIFKAFTRIDDSRNRETGGHGLGLAIVSRIAALHGGSVIADASEALGGARFTLSWAMPDS